MARLDSTAVWFQRGEDAAAMAETEGADEARRIPTLAWVGGAVALTAALVVGIALYAAHASRVLSAPLPEAPPATAPAVATPPAAAPTPQATVPAMTPITPSAVTPSAATPPRATAPMAAHGPHVTAEVLEGEKLLAKGRAGAALFEFQRTLAHDADDVRALRGACLSLGRLGRFNDAARVCRRALDRAPRDLETRRALATIYYNGGAYKWSATEWRRVVEQAPRDVRARRALRAAEARAGRG